jgi:hypothetical protein
LKAYAVIAQAGIAIGTLMPRIAHALAKADPSDHAQCMQQIGEAAEHTRQLLTRLEIAELELAASGAAAAPAAGEKAA